MTASPQDTEAKYADCTGCGKPIKGSDPNYGGDQWHSNCFKEAHPELLEKPKKKGRTLK